MLDNFFWGGKTNIMSICSYKTALALGFSMLASSAFTAENDAISLDALSLDALSYNAGLGPSYGGLVGMNLSLPLNDHIEIYGGLGATGAVGYVVGANYYIASNIRLTSNYGTNSSITLSSGTEAYQGLNIGVGYIFGKDRDGFSLDLYYRDLSALQSRRAQLRDQGTVLTGNTGNFGISLGYRF